MLESWAWLWRQSVIHCSNVIWSLTLLLWSIKNSVG